MICPRASVATDTDGESSGGCIYGRVCLCVTVREREQSHSAQKEESHAVEKQQEG